MKNIIVTGATGMVGGLVLDHCLKRNDVNKVTVITRRETGVLHLKLLEVIHEDFTDYSKIMDHFKNKDICIYCLGVYTGQVPKQEFREITVDYTKAFAEALKSKSDKSTFSFLSGEGADREEQSRMMFAKDKGAAENFILSLKFDKTYIFRPGYIYPVTPRKEPHITYKLARFLYKPVLSKIYPNIGISSADLAESMVGISLEGGNKTTCENKDIRKYSSEFTPP